MRMVASLFLVAGNDGDCFAALAARKDEGCFAALAARNDGLQ